MDGSDWAGTHIWSYCDLGSLELESHLLEHSAGVNPVEVADDGSD